MINTSTGWRLAELPQRRFREPRLRTNTIELGRPALRGYTQKAAIFAKVLVLTLTGLLVLASACMATPPTGVINADFSYRQLSVSSDTPERSISGLIQNRAGRSLTRIVIWFIGHDCVTGRQSWRESFYIKEIDAQEEVLFKLPAEDASQPICRLQFRTGYDVDRAPGDAVMPPPAKTVPRTAALQQNVAVNPDPVEEKPPQTIVAPQATSENKPQPETAPALPPEDQLYVWIDSSGTTHYSNRKPLGDPTQSPVRAIPFDERLGIRLSSDQPIYAWRDMDGSMYYSNTDPSRIPAVKARAQNVQRLVYTTLDEYHDAVKTLIAANWRRPATEAGEPLEYEAIVRFDTMRDGRIRNIAIEKSAGTRELDESCYNAVAKSDPLPPPPPPIQGEGRAVALRIIFNPNGLK